MHRWCKMLGFNSKSNEGPLRRNMEWSDFMEDQMEKSISCRINFGVESCILSQENIDRVHKIDHS